MSSAATGRNIITNQVRLTQRTGQTVPQTELTSVNVFTQTAEEVAREQSESYVSYAIVRSLGQTMQWSFWNGIKASLSPDSCWLLFLYLLLLLSRRDMQTNVLFFHFKKDPRSNLFQIIPAGADGPQTSVVSAAGQTSEIINSCNLPLAVTV